MRTMLVAAVCGILASSCAPRGELKIQTDNRTYSTFTRDGVDFLIWAPDTQSALEVADRELRCDISPCVISSGGVVLSVFRPPER